MGKAWGVRTVVARKQHNCYLCTIPIEPGTSHLSWTWKGDGAPASMRAHLACNSYAHDLLPGWTDDGVDVDAVEMDIKERLLHWQNHQIIGVDEREEAAVLAGWPELAALVAQVRAEILAEVE